MALAVVGGALLSAFIDVLFDRLASPEFVNFIRGKKPERLLQKMKSQLLVVKVVLADAEKRQISNSDVKDWLDLLIDLVYEVDDLLDEVSTKAATQKEVSNSFSRLFKRKKIVSISKLEDIVERLDDILKQKESLDLKDIPVESYQSWKAQPTSLEDGYGMYGRDKDKEAIMNMVLQDVTDDSEQVSVIPIVGMGGVGKTTLARSVFNDGKLKQQIFDLKAWVCVSDVFDIVNVTRTMIEEITRMPCKLSDLNALQLELIDKLKGKRYFIVLNYYQEARIMDKKHIKYLSLEWFISNDNSIDFQIELAVLSKLQPHQDLKSLSISGYKGTRFPEWVGNFSYRYMTIIRLYNCYKCCMLPSMGQLPSLRFLYISDMDSVKTIDAGFYKTEDCSSAIPFPSLESLHIFRMPSWELWSPFASKAFPVLKDIFISDCPKLRGAFPNHLPALERLTIRNCELLVSCVPRVPTFHEFPLLVKFIDEGGPMVESMMEAITNSHPSCLQSLTLGNCSSAISFPGDRLPASLKALEVRGLNKLKFPMQHKHELLESLRIKDSCDSLTSLPLAIFPSLTHLDIISCENMESLLVSRSESLKSLKSLEIEHCPNYHFWERDCVHPI